MRAAADASGHGVGILADLQGPKIRLGNFSDGPVELCRGAPLDDHHRVRSTATREVSGTTYKGLADDVRVGDPILIDDGKVRLRVTEVQDDNDVRCEVLVGGKVSNHKGINLPGVAVSAPALSEKDIEDLRFALHVTVDYIALSFVRSAADVEDVRRVMREESDHPGHRQDREARRRSSTSTR